MGDLAELAPSRDAFKAKLKASYSNYTDPQLPGFTGILYRFTHEMKVGDHVIYPRKSDRTVHLGVIAGGYVYQPSVDASFPNMRAVTWEKSLPRTAFQQTALHEIGSAITLFQVREHLEHFLEVFGGSAKPKESDEAAEGTIYTEVYESTEDFVIRRLEKHLKGAPLERFVKDLLEAMGYRCRLTKTSGDGGVDVEAARGPLGFEPPIVKAQVKSTTHNTSDADVKHLFASVNPGEFGLFVTLGGFTRPAEDFARSKANLSLVGGSKLVELILEHYDQLSPSSKAIIPMKHSLIPDVSS